MVPGITNPVVKKYTDIFLNNYLEIQELTDIISFVLLMHKKNNPSDHDDGRSCGGYPILLN